MKKEFKIRDLERQGLRRRKSIKVWESSVPTLGDVNLFFYHKKKIRRKKISLQHQRFNVDVRNDFPISDNWETEAWVASKKDGSTMFSGGLPKYFVKKSGWHVSGMVLPESGNGEGELPGSLFESNSILSEELALLTENHSSFFETDLYTLNRSVLKPREK